LKDGEEVGTPKMSWDIKKEPKHREEEGSYNTTNQQDQFLAWGEGLKCCKGSTKRAQHHGP